VILRVCKNSLETLTLSDCEIDVESQVEVRVISESLDYLDTSSENLHEKGKFLEFENLVGK
jgi:hypothetical protein